MIPSFQEYLGLCQVYENQSAHCHSHLAFMGISEHLNYGSHAYAASVLRAKCPALPFRNIISQGTLCTSY